MPEQLSSAKKSVQNILAGASTLIYWQFPVEKV
jgi:hypothetical protein